MNSAFCISTPLLRSAARQTIPSTSKRSLPARVARSRRSRLNFVSCVEQPEGSGAEEEEQLDEAAMRAAEIHEVLTGLRDFKTRIIDDATKLAKKVRAPKKELEAALTAHPDIIKIDGHIAELEEELKVLGDR